MQEKRSLDNSQKVADEIQARAWRKVMSSMEGRRVIRMILKESGVSTGYFVETAQLMAFNSGKRSLGIHVLDCCKVDPDNYKQMLIESVEDGIARIE